MNQTLDNSTSDENVEFTSWQFDIQKILLGLRRHLMIILLSAFIVSGFTLIYVFQEMRRLTATAILFYEEDLPQTLPGGYTLSHPSLFTVLDMILLPSNLQALKSVLGLQQSEEELREIITVPFAKSRSDLIRIQAEGVQSELLIDMVNTLARIIVKNSHSFYQSQLQAALDNYTKQLEVAHTRLAMQNQEIEQFQKSSSFYELGAGDLSLMQQIAEARKQLESATLQYNRQLVEYENLRREVKNLPVMRRQTVATPLQQRITFLETALASAKAKYTPDNPKVQKLEAEQQQLQEQIASEKTGSEKTLGRPTYGTGLEVELLKMQGNVRATQRLKEDLQKKLNSLEKNLESFPEYKLNYSKLLQEKARTEEQIKFLSEAIDTAQLLFNIPKGTVEIYQYAEESKGAKNKLVLALIPLFGFIVGLSLGLGFAFIMEIRDRRLRTPRQVEMAYGLPTLVEIPKIESLTIENSQTALLFYIRYLSESLEKETSRQFPGRKNRFSLTITSVRNHEGKSTIAYQLASYLHRLSVKTILVEFDYRPSGFFKGFEYHVSIERYLKGEAEFQELICSGTPDRISIGSYDPDLKEKIKSQRMEKLWEELRGCYEYIIVDAPGIVEDDYAVNLASYADLTLLVVDSSNTLKSEVDAALSELEHLGMTPCGVVLNKALPIYISDKRIQIEMKQHKHRARTG